MMKKLISIVAIALLGCPAIAAHNSKATQKGELRVEQISEQNAASNGELRVEQISEQKAASKSEQKAESKLLFETSAWNFGTIKEVDGPVSHIFTFTNTDSTAVVIERVTTSCGCTTPNYSRRPIMPGKSSEITISYDPTNRPGRFDKTITILSDNNRNRNILTITGNVVGRPRTVEDDYPYLLSKELRSNTSHLSFGYIAQGEVRSMTIELINTATESIVIDTTLTKSSGKITLTVPKQIEAGQRATITATCDLRQGQYGMLSDQVDLRINGKRATTPLTFNATAVDNFKGTSKRNAPKFGLQPSFYNFGEVERGKTTEKEFKIFNNGNRPLIIRAIEPRPNTRVALPDQLTIEAGGERAFNITLDIGEEDYGMTFGGVIIIANDPERPMREIRLSADVK